MSEDGHAEYKDDNGVSPKPHVALFAPEELDTLTEGADLSVPIEEEEFNKEREGRIYYLDEVELKRRVKENMKQQKEPTLSDLGVMLGFLKKRWLGRGRLRQANYALQNTGSSGKVGVGFGE
ncbi:hypothetical protein GN958_ATG04687 [Phytophthora infestans]|uniref:Uncharacterized protein n=1 Tax=Phytophthora infestans TaxID=4787 RepID=A0A8S9V4B9_PHYIN|nr:hypothetical protein GN958_ATG08194 [Phytophthora infestans]KAF4146212.1 hypothetical protein GN958_ATG04687 [Phytophthora infestans]